MTEHAKSQAQPILLSIMHFGTLEVNGMHTVSASTLRLRDGLLHRKRLRGVFCANPSTREVFVAFVLKLLLGPKLKIALFDLVLRRPTGPWQHLLVKIKAIFLKAADLVLCIHRDTRGYEEYYGIKRSRIRYIPFKPNNFATLDNYSSTDGDYLFCCGASQRDHATLLKAVDGLGIRTTIVLSDRGAQLHNSNMPEGDLPDCVERIREPLAQDRYYAMMAGARVVVVPILPRTIQPAGISVYLEAMALAKPTIITEGSSTLGILDAGMAVLVPPGDAVALRGAIEALWHDAERRRQIGRSGQHYARSLGGNERMTSDIAKELDVWGVA